MVMLMPTRRQWTQAKSSLRNAVDAIQMHMATTAGDANNSAELSSAMLHLGQAAEALGFDLVPRAAANDMSART